MRHRNLAFAIATALAAAAPARGQTIYFDRLLFLADPAAAVTTSLTFDGLAPGTDLTGATLGGVTLNAPAGGATPFAVILGAAGVRMPMSPSSGANVLSPGGSDPSLQQDDLELLFASPMRAAGFDVVFDAPDGLSFVSVSFLDGVGNTLCSNGFIPSPVGPPGYQFVGCTSPIANIARIVVDEFDDTSDFQDDNVAYDSFVFGPVATSAVPEPATLGLVALGLVALPLARRARRR